jgi:hypothetical protein
MNQEQQEYYCLNGPVTAAEGRTGGGTCAGVSRRVPSTLRRRRLSARNRMPVRVLPVALRPCVRDLQGVGRPGPVSRGPSECTSCRSTRPSESTSTIPTPLSIDMGRSPHERRSRNSCTSFQQLVAGAGTRRSATCPRKCFDVCCYNPRHITCRSRSLGGFAAAAAALALLGFSSSLVQIVFNRVRDQAQRRDGKMRWAVSRCVASGLDRHRRPCKCAAVARVMVPSSVEDRGIAASDSLRVQVESCTRWGLALRNTGNVHERFSMVGCRTPQTTPAPTAAAAARATSSFLQTLTLLLLLHGASKSAPLTKRRAKYSGGRRDLWQLLYEWPMLLHSAADSQRDRPTPLFDLFEDRCTLTFRVVKRPAAGLADARLLRESCSSDPLPVRFRQAVQLMIHVPITPPRSLGPRAKVLHLLPRTFPAPKARGDVLMEQ